MVVLDKFNRGKRIAVVGHGVTAYICFSKNEDKVRGSIKTNVPTSGKISCVSCSDLFL
jgi:hypothetical protein